MTSDPSRSPGRLRRVLAAVLPTVIGACVLLVAIEYGLRWFDFRRHVPLSGDPFVNVTPFFFRATDASGVPVFRHYGWQLQFLATKPPNGFRVFVLGESSVYGIPYEPPYSFAAFLQKRLAAALPDRVVEVVNCGVPAIASWHVRRIGLEVMQYQPDVVLVYAGHNDYTTREMPEPGRWMRQLVEQRTFQLAVWGSESLRQWWSGPFDKGLALDPAQPFLMGARATGASTMTAAERREIPERFARNVRDLIDAAKRVGAVPMVASVGQNFRDWAPSAWRHTPALAPADAARWGQHWVAGEQKRKANDCAGAIAEYDAAIAADPHPAIVHFGRAKCLDRLGRWEEAREAYRRASDLDEVPMGVPTSFNAVVRRTARDAGAVFVDVARRLDDDSPHRLLGNEVFMDHLHPNLLGNERIAAIIADRLRELGLPEPATAWVDGYQDPDPAALRRENPKIAEMEKFSLDLTKFFVNGGGAPASGAQKH
jgi:lysophospholipase L1-like esterase